MNATITLPRATLLGSLVAVGLSACGGSSSNNPTSKTVSGAVLGSYVQGAIVCVDANSNGRCDSTDTHRVVSGANGSYTFSDLPIGLFDKPIVVEVPQGASIIDPKTSLATTVTSEFSLSFPPSDSNDRNVSSLSTLVNSEFLKSGDLAKAKQTVAKQLSDAGVAITSDQLFDNYVAKAIGTGASSDQVKLYNTAKLAGTALQQAQAGTKNDATGANFDNNQLLKLVATQVFNNIDAIITMAKNHTTLVNQATAASSITTLASSIDLGVTATDVANANALAEAGFNMGTLVSANIFNTQQGAAGTWSRGTYVVFEPTVDVTDVEAYRKSIPSNYQIGVFDAAGAQVLSYNFHGPNWEAGAATKINHSYSLRNGRGSFKVYSETSSISAAAGDYSFVLCTQTCAKESGRIALATHTLTPKPDAFNNISAKIDGVFSSEMELYRSATKITQSDGKRLVGTILPRPPLGSYLRLDIGVDLDSDGLAQQSKSPGNGIGGVKTVDVPEEWITQNKPIYARLQLRDKRDFRNISWRYASDYKLVTPTIRSSFAIESYGRILGDFYDSTTEFSDGISTSFDFNIADGNPLTAVHLEGFDGTTQVSLCLPTNIPSSQSKLSTYNEQHINQGNKEGEYFIGCQNHDLKSDFDLKHEDHYANVRLRGQTHWNMDKEILHLSIYAFDRDTNNQWGENNPKLDELQYLVATFADGTKQKILFNLIRPDHVFNKGHGSPSASICSFDAYNVRLSWTPPSWMQADFDAGKIGINSQIKARYDEHNPLGTYSSKLPLGATSTIMPKTVIESLTREGKTIDNFQVRIAMGDRDYYGFDEATYNVKIWLPLTRAQVLEAPACTN